MFFFHRFQVTAGGLHGWEAVDGEDAGGYIGLGRGASDCLRFTAEEECHQCNFFGERGGFARDADA